MFTLKEINAYEEYYEINHSTEPIAFDIRAEIFRNTVWVNKLALKELLKPNLPEIPKVIHLWLAYV